MAENPASTEEKPTKNLEKSSDSSASSNMREKTPIWGTSVGYAAGRSTIFVYLAYFGVVLGASPLEQSILTSVRNLGSNIFQSVWGWLADLRGRKLVIAIGLSTLALTTLLTPFSSAPIDLVIISLIMTSIGFSIIPAWNAFLGDYSSEKDRASFVGKINSIGTVTSIFFILVLGILMELSPFPFPQLNPDGSNNYIDVTPIFFIPFFSSALVFGVTIIISFFLIEKYFSREKVVIEEEFHPSWRTLIERNPPFRRLLPINTFFSFVMSTAWPIFPFVTLRVADSWLMVAFMWIVFNLPRGFGQMYGGKLADIFNKKIIIVISRLGYVTVPIGYAIGLVTGNVWFLILVNILGGLAFGAEDTSVATYSLDCSTEETKGRYYSILLTAGGLSAFIGSLFAGFVMDIWLKIAGISYNSIEFNSILFLMLICIGILRFVSAVTHKFIYSNPLDFELDLLTST
ncbi:MAG: MFS transporter [Candidatus Heimdallarchaeota archaeon]|nr:MAG: MFS transporter [Candidatus Heimdallarchaeota archaeon]